MLKTGQLSSSLKTASTASGGVFVGGLSTLVLMFPIVSMILAEFFWTRPSLPVSLKWKSREVQHTLNVNQAVQSPGLRPRQGRSLSSCSAAQEPFLRPNPKQSWSGHTRARGVLTLVLGQPPRGVSKAGLRGDAQDSEGPFASPDSLPSQAD